MGPTFSARTTSIADALDRPRLRGWFHTVAFFVSVPAGLALVLLAPDMGAAVAVLVYAFSLSAVFAASASYHRIAWSTAALRRMKRLDHSMIFVLIAGTYTPVCALALGRPWSVVLLSVVWAGAAVGIGLKNARVEGLHAVTGAMYVVLGWVGVVALPELVRSVPPAASALMIVGGVLYTVGALVLLRRRPDPVPSVFGYHEVWHAFMVTAAACHYVMILVILRAAG